MDDEDLLAQFESHTIPFELWRQHRTHVKVSFLMLRKYPFELAVEKVKATIQAVNQANGVPEGPLEGYNETTTHALLHLIDATMRAYGEACPTPDADTFCDTHPQLATKHVLRLFYSPERRLHPDAKHAFIAPDLAPLPRVVGKVN
ncbi:hypothetical protein OT109_03640 [Phycisphaeraceae bacterium D3-23]